MGYLIHQKGYKPRIFPYLLNPGSAEIDRAQTLDLTATLNKTAINELGRDGVAAWVKDDTVTGGELTQMEYGSLEFFRKLANKLDATTDIVLSDFDNSAFDIASYLIDNNSAFFATLVNPKQRLTGFSITIGDPTALISRRFSFTGEEAVLWQGNNKYYIEQVETVASGELSGVGGDDFVVTLNNPVPVADPDNSGVYILRVVRVRSSVTSELTLTTDYTFSAPSTFTVLSAQVGDVYKIYYTATTYVDGGTAYFTANDSDLFGIRAHSAVLYLGTSNRLYKVQSATIDVRFDREDIKEIGNPDVVARGVKNKTVTVTLGGLLDSDLTLEEVLRGESSGYGKINYDSLSNNLTFICALYSDSGHGTFKMGYKATKMAVTDIKPGTGNVDSHADQSVTLQGEDLTITSLVATLGI